MKTETAQRLHAISRSVSHAQQKIQQAHIDLRDNIDCEKEDGNSEMAEEWKHVLDKLDDADRLSWGAAGDLAEAE